VNRFIVRKEIFGGLLYDKKDTKTYMLSRDQFDDVLKKNPKDIDFVLNTPADCSTLSAPTRVFLEITKKCNLKCIYCSNDSSANKKEELSLPEVERILLELKAAGVFEISFNGGEPVCHKDFFRMVELAKEMGFVVLMNTNGVYTDEQLEKLACAKVDKIKISIDGMREHNDLLRGKGTFDRALFCTRHLKERGNKVKILCTLLKDNLNGAVSLGKFANESGYNLKIAPLYLVGRAKTLKNKIISLEELESVRSQINEYCEQNRIENRTNIATSLFADSCGVEADFKLKHIDCCNNRLHSFIDVNGNLYNTGCQTFLWKYDPAGNIKKQRFFEIWKKVQEDNEKKKNASLECRQCDIFLRLSTYFSTTNDYFGEVWENEKTKIIF